MGDKSGRALYQSFPMQGRARAQVWCYSPHYRRPRHFHAEPELNLVVAGSAMFGVGDSSVAAIAGDLLGFPPGQDHVMLHGSSDLILYAIGIDPALSSEILGPTRVGVAAPLRIRLASNEFEAIVARTLAVAEQDGVEPKIAELWEQANHPRLQAAHGSDSAIHVLTRRTLSTISNAPDMGREALARHARAHPSEISRHFHRDLGMTLVQYRARLRLLRFIRLVDDRARNLTAAAIAAGFGSYSQCHRSFQAEFECAPRRFFLSGLREQMEQVLEPLSG